MAINIAGLWRGTN